MAKGTYHRVRDGQDLVFLAEWYYGDSTAWSHIYGDDFEKIPAGSPVFIPDLETSDVIESYTGPAVTVNREKGYPVRTGPVNGYFNVEQEDDGTKTLLLVFEGEGQEAD
jgi:hypothetical protein